MVDYTIKMSNWVASYWASGHGNEKNNKYTPTPYWNVMTDIQTWVSPLKQDMFIKTKEASWYFMTSVYDYNSY